MIKRRLSELDPIDSFNGGGRRLSLQVGLGTICFVAAVLTRAFIDMFATGAGPFSLIFPAIMIATLYGRWQAGMVTFALAFLHAWYVVLPYAFSFTFENPNDQARTIVNGSVALIILFFAEVFRSAVRRMTKERDRELAVQQSLMKELEHRTKNNFAMVSSLLSMQQRRSASDEVKQALMSAASRVQSFAAIHETIYAAETYSADIFLPHYLAPLIRQLESGLFENGRVTVELQCDPTHVARERALAFGLIINELVTNAAKHAFPEGRKGKITVTYREPSDAPWSLSVIDDGCGIGNAPAPNETAVGSGLGKILMSSFATTAGGVVQTEDRPVGTSVTLTEIKT